MESQAAGKHYLLSAHREKVKERETKGVSEETRRQRESMKHGDGGQCEDGV